MELYEKYNKKELETLIRLLSDKTFVTSHHAPNVDKSRSYLCILLRLNIPKASSKYKKTGSIIKMYDEFVHNWLESEKGKEMESDEYQF